MHHDFGIDGVESGRVFGSETEENLARTHVQCRAGGKHSSAHHAAGAADNADVAEAAFVGIIATLGNVGCDAGGIQQFALRCDARNPEVVDLNFACSIDTSGSVEPWFCAEKSDREIGLNGRAERDASVCRKSAGNIDG